MKKKIQKILIICSGNTARSPAGEYLAKFYNEKYGSGLFFDSAGFFNAFSYMQPESQEYLDSKGINHSDFKPKTISRNLLKTNDLIITMTSHHIEQIMEAFSDLQGINEKTFTIKAFNGGKGDIIDPYYTNRSTYFVVMEELDELIENMIKKIDAKNKDIS